jgi:hypothetical protein
VNEAGKEVVRRKLLGKILRVGIRVCGVQLLNGCTRAGGKRRQFCEGWRMRLLLRNLIRIDARLMSDL